jgi:hypothetical protein
MMNFMRKMSLAKTGLVGLVGLGALGACGAGLNCYANRVVEGMSEGVREASLVPIVVNDYVVAYSRDDEKR